MHPLNLKTDRITTGIIRARQKIILQTTDVVSDTPNPIMSPGVQQNIIVIISRKHNPPENDENKYKIMWNNFLFFIQDHSIHSNLRKIPAEQQIYSDHNAC